MSTLAGTNSRWFRQYEQEVQGKRQAGNKNKSKILFIILPVMFLAFAGLAMMNGGAGNSPQAQNDLPFLLGIPVFIVFFVLILTSRAKK